MGKFYDKVNDLPEQRGAGSSGGSVAATVEGTSAIKRGALKGTHNVNNNNKKNKKNKNGQQPEQEQCQQKAVKAIETPTLLPSLSPPRSLPSI